jgi:signal transduction histidine kinase
MGSIVKAGDPDLLYAAHDPSPVGAAAMAWQIAGHLFGSNDPHEVLCRIVATGRDLAGADAAALLLYDRGQAVFVPTIPPVARGLDERWLQREGLAAMQALARHATAARSTLHLDDSASNADFALPSLASGEPLRAARVLPNSAGDGEVLGVLYLFSAAPLFPPLPVDPLTAFIAVCGLALANAQTHQREQAQRARLEALDEASKAIAVHVSPRQVLQRIVEIATTIGGARYGALGIVGDDGYLADFITAGISAEERERIGHLPRGHGLLGTLIRLGQPLRVPNMWHDPRRVGFPPHHPPMTSLLGVPVRVRNVVIGDLYLTDKIGAAAFSEDDQHLIEMLAAHAGIAIENARLQVQAGEWALVQERERFGRELHDGIIQDIYGATLQLEDIAEDMQDEASRVRLVNVGEHLSHVITDVRIYIQGLRPRLLAGRPLAEGIAAAVHESNEQHPTETTFQVSGTPYQVSDEHATALLQIAKEALANAHKHAAASRLDVCLLYDLSGVSITVSDDGRGFDPSEQRGEHHRGLPNLRARAAMAEGSVTVRSAPGAGTVVAAFIPTA